LGQRDVHIGSRPAQGGRPIACPLYGLQRSKRARLTGPRLLSRTSSDLGSIAQRIDERGERRCGLPAAWVVEMVARKRRAPIPEHALETTLGDMRLRQVFRHVGQAESSQRRIEHLGGAVEDELAFDTHILQGVEENGTASHLG
jgi:hypothetical protein